MTDKPLSRAEKAYSLFVLVVLWVMLFIVTGMYLAIQAGWWNPDPIKLGIPTRSEVMAIIQRLR